MSNQAGKPQKAVFLVYKWLGKGWKYAGFFDNVQGTSNVLTYFMSYRYVSSGLIISGLYLRFALEKVRSRVIIPMTSFRVISVLNVFYTVEIRHQVGVFGNFGFPVLVSFLMLDNNFV